MMIKRRSTVQKSAIYDTLKMLGHSTAEEVYNKIHSSLPDISLATVYRNLSVLADEGMIKKVPTTSSPDLYDGNAHNHYHFRCKECGSIVDVPCSYMSELDEKCSKDLNVQIDSHSLKFSGVCEECLKKHGNNDVLQ